MKEPAEERRNHQRRQEVGDLDRLQVEQSKRVHAVIEVEQFADHDARQHADQKDERVFRVERHLYPVDGHEEAETGADRLLEAGGDDAAQAQANCRAGEHAGRVEGGAKARGHGRAGGGGRPTSYSFSKRSTLTMKTVAPPTWTSTG